MAMDFSIKEARQLMDRHKALLSNLDDIATKAAGMQADIKSSANDLLVQPFLKRLILHDCTHTGNASARNADAERLICHLYRYEKAHSAIETAKSFRNYAEKNVRESIERLNPGLAGLSWLLGGKRTKELAAQAYRELSDLQNGSYGQTIPHLVADVNAVAYVAPDLAWGAFVNDPELFLDTLESVCPQTIHAAGENPFRTLLLQLAALEQKVSKCQTDSDQEQEKIKSAAEKVMAYNALQILRGVPIEEVNREKAGFRVKTLREAGLTNMADVYSSSSYQLAALNGISDHAAYSLKRIAKNFLQEAQQGVKIKLNADDKNKYATDLIRAIYTYRIKKTSREELLQTVQNKQDALASAKETLQSVGNGLPWLFFAPDQRADVRDGYQEIKQAVDGEYAKTVTRLSGILLNNRTVPSDEVVWNDFSAHNIEYFSILEEVLPGVLGNDDGLYGLPEELAREIQEEILFPEGLLCTLRRYQEWGVKYILHQKKVLLGDEMGLGKTVQAIATMVSLKNTGATHFIVVCPASVITNWCREIVKHSKLRVTKIHGAGKEHALNAWMQTGGVAVTTFETTASITDQSLEKLDLMIVDEAHYIKNPEAMRSINVKRLCEKADRLLFMTGTALENKVEEMVSLIDILQPDVAESVKSMTFMPSAPQFRDRVAPVYYRRKRDDVLTELPELIETQEWCVQNAEEKELYEQNVLSGKYTASRRLSWDVENLNDSCKATRLREIVEQAKAEDRKVLVFSFFLDTIRSIHEFLGDCCYGPINGSVPVPRRQSIIDEFDKAPAGSVLLAQIQSGGTGLNIQSASVVVICEPQFKPSIENQAISRAYRMGQARNVLVYRLLCTNTIDERLTELLAHKQELFDAFADKSVAAEQNEDYNVEIDEKNFGQLIQEEIKRINAQKGIPSPFETE